MNWKKLADHLVDSEPKGHEMPQHVVDQFDADTARAIHDERHAGTGSAVGLARPGHKHRT